MKRLYIRPSYRQGPVQGDRAVPILICYRSLEGVKMENLCDKCLSPVKAAYSVTVTMGKSNRGSWRTSAKIRICSRCSMTESTFTLSPLRDLESREIRRRYLTYPLAIEQPINPCHNNSIVLGAKLKQL